MPQGNQMDVNDRWAYMDEQMDAAIQTMNPNGETPIADQQQHAAEIIQVDQISDNHGPRRSNRKPLYSKKYLKYRAALLTGEATEDDTEFDDAAMAAFN